MELFNNNIELINGWFDIENDGIRDFRWSSTDSTFLIKNVSSTKSRFIELIIGSPDECILGVSSKKDTIIYKKIYSGWRKYVFDLQAFDVEYHENEIMIINFKVNRRVNAPGEARNLGIMIEKADFITVFNSSILNNTWENIFIDNNIVITWKINENNEIEGSFYINDISTCVSQKTLYFDIIYSSETRGTLQFNDQNMKLLEGCNLLCLECDNVKSNEGFFFKIDHEIFFEKITLRKDYYDFLGLQKYFLAESYNNWEETNQESKELGLEIQWFVTWLCNYRCPYCWQENSREEYRELNKLKSMDAGKWANAFNKLNPRSIVFTGGEPTLYNGLPALIKLLNKEIKLSITTNISLDVNYYIKNISPDRFLTFIMSFHPTQISFQDFVKKVNVFISAGFENLLIELVLYKDNMQYARPLLEFCSKKNISVRLEKYVDPNSVSDPFYLSQEFEDEKCKLISSAIEINKRVNAKGMWLNYNSYEQATIKVQDTNDNMNANNIIWCPAGKNKIHVDSNGDVYSCMSAVHRNKVFGASALPHYRCMGNILAHDFTLESKPILCWESFRCSDCDYRYLAKSWGRCQLKDSRDIMLPIPT